MPSLDGLNPAAGVAPETDAITGGTLNLTKTSTYIAALGALFVGIDPLFGQAFPDSLHPTAGVKAAIIIGILGAWAIMIAADLLARGYASARQSAPGPALIPAPGQLYAKTTDGEDDPNWLVAGIQVSRDDPPRRPSCSQRTDSLRSGWTSTTSGFRGVALAELVPSLGLRWPRR